MDVPSPPTKGVYGFFKWERKYGEVFSKNYNFSIRNSMIKI